MRLVTMDERVREGLYSILLDVVIELMNAPACGDKLLH